MAYSTVAERPQAEAVTFQFPNASLKSGEDSPESKNPSQGFHLLACKTRYFTQLPVISSFQFLNSCVWICKNFLGSILDASF